MWVKVAKTDEVAEGGSKVAEANGQPLALFKVGGTIYALDNTCPHQGGPLGEGYLDGSEVTCPWHAWVFDVKTGKCQTTSEITQKSYKTKIDGDDVLVDVA